MKKCVIMPDSFKHTMSSLEICEIIAKTIQKYFPECQTIMIPIADGGEGTTDCILHLGAAEKITLVVSGPYLEPVQVYYARIKDRAVIEIAQAAGLPLVENRQNPAETTSYGVAVPFYEARKTCHKDLEATMESIMRFQKLWCK